jgi:hypothetical protein
MKKKSGAIKQISAIAVGAVMLFSTVTTSVTGNDSSTGTYHYASNRIPEYFTSEEFRQGDFRYVFVSDDVDGVVIVGYDGDALNIVVPPFLDNHPVLGVGRSVFSGQGIQSVILQYGVTFVDREAFAWNLDMQTFDIPNTVFALGAYALHGAESLRALVIPASVEYIGAMAFSWTVSLKHVYFLGAEPPVFGTDVFFMSGIETIRIPVGARESYADLFPNIEIIQSCMYTNCGNCDDCGWAREVVTTPPTCSNSCAVCCAPVLTDTTTTAPNTGRTTLPTSPVIITTRTAAPTSPTTATAHTAVPTSATTQEVPTTVTTSAAPPTSPVTARTPAPTAGTTHETVPVTHAPTVPTIRTATEPVTPATVVTDTTVLPPQHCCGCPGQHTIIIVFPGRVMGNETIGINDALAILRFLVNLPSIINDCDGAYRAALIVSADTPSINDALQILRYLVGLSSVLN